MLKCKATYKTSNKMLSISGNDASKKVPFFGYPYDRLTSEECRSSTLNLSCEKKVHTFIQLIYKHIATNKMIQVLSPTHFSF